jgi:hypothetical protein
MAAGCLREAEVIEWLWVGKGPCDCVNEGMHGGTARQARGVSTLPSGTNGSARGGRVTRVGRGQLRGRGSGWGTCLAGMILGRALSSKGEACDR